MIRTIVKQYITHQYRWKIKKLFYANVCCRIRDLGKPTVDRNMPTMTGQLKWAKELHAKMSHSVKGFRDLNHPICYREGARKVLQKYKEICSWLSTYEEEVFQLWNLGISNKISQSLNRPLVLRDTARGTIKVNLAREIISMLRDVSI